MERYFGEIVINKVPYAVMRNATITCPFAQSSDGRFASLRKDSAETQAVDVDEGRVIICDCSFHATHAAPSRRVRYVYPC